MKLNILLIFMLMMLTIESNAIEKKKELKPIEVVNLRMEAHNNHDI
jgi:hypothetical protein